jgi:hypothetical protein
VEALFNRSIMIGNSIKQELHSGFYGPVNRGQLPQLQTRSGREIKRASTLSLAAAIKNRTDQGSGNDPNGGPGRIMVPGTR